MIITKQEFHMDETDIVCKVEVVLGSGFRNEMYFTEDVDLQDDSTIARLFEQAEERERMWIDNGRWNPITKEVVKHNAKW